MQFLYSYFVNFEDNIFLLADLLFLSCSSSYGFSVHFFTDFLLFLHTCYLDPEWIAVLLIEGAVADLLSF
jgi:hypothetical protein